MLNAAFYFSYGAAAEQAGLFDKAAELLKQKHRTRSEQRAQAYNYLGYMWVDRGEQLDEAGELIKKASRWSRRMARIPRQPRLVLFQKGRLPER